MCFSANASFATAGTLTVIGLLSIHKAAHNKKLIPLAASPLFFALQQTCEGLVWITLNKGDTTSVLHTMCTYGFLLFASVWWPIWIPLSGYIAERIPKRKFILFLLCIIGAVTALLLFTSWTLLTTQSEIANHHINYPVANYPFGITDPCIAQIMAGIIAAMYCTAVIVPFFVSSIAYAWIIGIITCIGFMVAYLFYIMAFGSVWCFFAAITSLLLYFII
jgi:hypothetical protein